MVEYNQKILTKIHARGGGHILRDIGFISEDEKMNRCMLWLLVFVMILLGGCTFGMRQDKDGDGTAALTDTRKYTTLLVSLKDPPAGLTPAKGDGTDETAVIQAIIDYAVENQKIILIPANDIFVVDGLLIRGKRNFSILGYGTLKHKKGGSEAILKISECSGFSVRILHTDGNVKENYSIEGKVNQNLHSLAIYNSHDFKVGSLYDINPAGDSLCMNNVANVSIESIDAKADEPSGRNALSITKAQYITINSVVSDNVGYRGMPGGIALEPNYKEDHIQNILIRSAVIRSGAENGLAVTNKTSAVVKDIEINAQITKFNPSESQAFKLNNIENFKGNVKVYQEGADLCTGASITGCKNVNADLEIYNSIVGLGIGKDSFNLYLTGKIIGAQEAGLVMWEGVSDCTIDMEIKQTGLDGRNGRVKVTDRVENVEFKGDYSYDGTGIYCFWLAGMIINSQADHLDAGGWAVNNLVTGPSAADLSIDRVTASRKEVSQAP